MAARRVWHIGQPVRLREEAVTSRGAVGDGLFRLSRFVLFVDYGEEMEVQHTVRGTTVRVPRATYLRLLDFRGFRPLVGGFETWVEQGVLVPPYSDTHEWHGGLRPGTEAYVAQQVEDWYWAREVEAEREYKWLGRNIVKMPCDLFLYQELMVEHGIRSVLEVGSGDGGSLQFFAGILALLGGGSLVGVDLLPCRKPTLIGPEQGVHVTVLQGDGHAPEVARSAVAIVPGGFGLVIIDAEPTAAGKAALLNRWAAALATGGVLVLEDIGSPACAGAVGIELVDDFLLADARFGLSASAARFPFLKSRGAVFQRLG